MGWSELCRVGFDTLDAASSFRGRASAARDTDLAADFFVPRFADVVLEVAIHPISITARALSGRGIPAERLTGSPRSGRARRSLSSVRLDLACSSSSRACLQHGDRPGGWRSSAGRYERFRVLRLSSFPELRSAHFQHTAKALQQAADGRSACLAPSSSPTSQSTGSRRRKLSPWHWSNVFLSSLQAKSVPSQGSRSRPIDMSHTIPPRILVSHRAAVWATAWGRHELPASALQPLLRVETYGPRLVGW